MLFCRFSGPGKESALQVTGYRARVEQEMRVDVSAYDWNCQQHITPRFSAEELAPLLEPMRTRISELEAENQRLRGLHVQEQRH